MSSAKIVKSETILLAIYGATAGVIGITKIEAAINQAILAIQPNNDKIHNDFLFFSISTVFCSDNTQIYFA